MRTILCLRQGRDKHKEAYYRIFEAAISTADMENFNATTHMELYKAYSNVEDEDVTKRFQSMCIIISAESYQYSGIWNDLKNSTLLVTENCSKTTTAKYNLLCRYKKLVPPCQLHVSPSAVTSIKSGDTENNKATPGNKWRSFPEVTCYSCQETGHYVGKFSSYTANTRTASQSLKVLLTMTQTTN